MVRLTRDAILAADDLKRELVTVPEWGGDVYVLEMSGAVRDAWEMAVVANRHIARAITVVHSVVDENNVRIFKEEDAEELSKKSGRALTRIANVARRISKLSEREVEDVKGNSEPDRSEDSATD